MHNQASMIPFPPPLEVIPEHLRPYIVEQHEASYTPADHAAWRFILRISRAFFAEHAHDAYLRGLEQTGISTDRIPRIDDMDQKLRRFGWRAVGVSGFIPPAVFMEFQSLGVLPIATEMRTLEHLAYTPAPDIVHEAAGHAPILADPAYAAYLRAYGEVSRRAIASQHDQALFEAIRELSDLKEDPSATPAQVQMCQERLEAVIAQTTDVSEAAALARMFWWTVEYGLVGSLDNPRIYGAGLLSSVAESASCLEPPVRHLPLTMECVQTSYDITRPQPQLFVVPDFQTLSRLLNDFAERMAFRRGGPDALAKARAARTVTTTVLDSGVQISGILDSFRCDARGRPCFVRYSGPVQLSVDDRELEGQGPRRHAEGFSTPLGLLHDGRDPSGLTVDDLSALGFGTGSVGELRFASGIVVRGRLVSRHLINDRPALWTLESCSIRDGDAVLYDPAWGPFDLVCGGSVVSVFGGPADRASYLAATGPGQVRPYRPKNNLTPENQSLNALYAQIRQAREQGASEEWLQRLCHAVSTESSHDWLSRLEVLELARARSPLPPPAARLERELREIAATDPGAAPLIARGLAILGVASV